MLSRPGRIGEDYARYIPLWIRIKQIQNIHEKQNYIESIHNSSGREESERIISVEENGRRLKRMENRATLD